MKARLAISIVIIVIFAGFVSLTIALPLALSKNNTYTMHSDELTVTVEKAWTPLDRIFQYSGVVSAIVSLVMGSLTLIVVAVKGHSGGS
jgi:hypothetical protein